MGCWAGAKWETRKYLTWETRKYLDMDRLKEHDQEKAFAEEELIAAAS